MKKLLFGFLVAFVVTAIIVASCSKQSSTGNSDMTDMTALTQQSSSTVLNDPPPPPAGCQCVQGQASCSESCTFSNCCVCWFPQQETGGCGCYFGIAVCKTEPIDPPDRLAQQKTSKANIQVRFHDDKIQEYFSLISDEFNIPEQMLKSYNHLIKASKKQEGTSTYNADVTLYYLFVDEYKKFIDPLTDTQKSKIEQIIASM